MRRLWVASIVGGMIACFPVGAVSGGAVQAAVTGHWTATGSMRVARDHFAWTALRDGRVLVVGGQGGTVTLRSTELYDPSRGTWSAGPPMHVPRYGPSATLLRDGRVMVAGGYCRALGGDLETAEIYDPSTNSWTWTNRMLSFRREHDATLLHDGRVLVTGGFEGDTVTALAEIFDPGSQRWLPAPPMSSPRLGHTATVLPGGRVLVTGGEMPRGVVAPILPGLPAGAYFRGPAGELFDPTTMAWLPTGGMHIRRNSHTATLLADGTVLIAGGYNPIGDGQVASAEIFDEKTLLFAPISPMNVARAGHSAVLLADGSVLVAGGKRDRSGALGSVERYLPAGHTWVRMPDMIGTHTFALSMRLPDGRVLVAGGASGPGAGDTAGAGDSTGAETYSG